MGENFDDEKIASMESFSKMAKDYAEMDLIGNRQVRVLNDDENVDLTDLALRIEGVGELLQKLSNLDISNDIRQFFSKLYDVNKIELDDIVRIFELKNFNTHNPIKNFFRQNNILDVINQIVIKETKNIQSMLEAMDKNISKDKKQWLKNAITRRLNMIELILE